MAVAVNDPSYTLPGTLPTGGTDPAYDDTTLYIFVREGGRWRVDVEQGFVGG